MTEFDPQKLAQFNEFLKQSRKEYESLDKTLGSAAESLNEHIRAEKETLNLAKKLGVEYKTQLEMSKDSLSQMNLSERLAAKIKHTEESRNILQQQTINSIGQINALTDANKQLEEKSIEEFVKRADLTSKFTLLQDKIKKGAQIEHDLKKVILRDEHKLLAARSGTLTLSKADYDALEKKVAKTNQELEIKKKKNESIRESIKNTAKEINSSKDITKELNGQIKLNRDIIKDEELHIQNAKREKEALAAENALLRIQKTLVDSISNAAKAIANELKIPTSSADVLKDIYNTFKEIDKVATDIRQQFALFPADAKELNTQIMQSATELAAFGASATDVGVTMKALGGEFSYLTTQNKGLVNDVTLLNKQFGISADTSAKFLKTMGGVSGKSAESSQNMLSLAGAAAKAYGVGLNDIMNDVASASDDARMFAGRNADEMVRAAAQARQMGTSLENMAKTSKGLLDFESSIQNELKASALIGKNINFNEARRLAFQGKTVEANKLILDQAKKIKFNQLNPIAQEAFAKAAGKSVKELQDMLEAETRIKDALHSQDPAVRKIAQEKLKEQNLLKTNKKLAQDQFEQDLKSKANQERLAVIQNQIKSLILKQVIPAVEMLTNLAQKVANWFEETSGTLNEMAGPILKISGVWYTFSGQLSKDVTTATKLGGGIKNLFTTIGSGAITSTGAVKNILKTVTGSFGSLARLGGGLALGPLKLAAAFLKALGPIGAVVTAIQSIYAFYKGFTETKGDFGKKLVGGLKAVLDALILEPIRMISNINFGELYGEISDKFIDALSKIPTVLQSMFSPEGGGSTGINWKNLFKQLGLLLINGLMLSIYKFPVAILKIIPSLAVAMIKGLLLVFVKLPFMLGKFLGEAMVNGISDLLDWFTNYDWSNIGTDISGGILKGINAVWGSVKEYLIQPFEEGWDWLKKTFLGNSPSQLGLGIVNGIKSVADMLFGVLTLPFKTGFELIKSAVTVVADTIGNVFGKAFDYVTKALEVVWEKIKGIGGLIANVVGKGVTFVSKIVGGAETAPAAGATTAATPAPTAAAQPIINTDLIVNAIVSSNNKLAAKVDDLISMMSSGKIAVYIDGQKANQLLAASSQKFGSFGQATTT